MYHSLYSENISITFEVDPIQLWFGYGIVYIVYHILYIVVIGREERFHLVEFFT